MTFYHPVARAVGCLASLALISATTGCGKQYSVAQVDGRLTIGGKPANKIHIQFIPASLNGLKLPMSNADTDAEGKFTLEMREGNTTHPGAVVGTNRVVLSDMQFAEAGSGRGMPFRLKPEYTLPGSTPLTQEVVEGNQTIALKIP